MKIRKKWRTARFSLFLITALLAIFVVFVTTDYFDAKPAETTISAEALYLDSTQPIEARVANLLSYMTLEEKVGQMALIEKNSIKEPSDIATFSLGGLLSGAGSRPDINTSAGWKQMIDSYQLEASKSRLGIPLLYGADAVHGHAHVEGVTVFPHAIGLGASGNPELVEKIAKATADELVVTGVNWNFAPNLDQARDIRWGRVYETFSDDPVLISKLGVAYVKGLQNRPDETDDRIRVLATAKHFIGLGGMSWGSSLNQNFKIDQGVTEADEEILRTVYLPPFIEAIDSGALSIMVGLNTWGDERMVRQKKLLTDVLKEELGFKGFVVSDWYGVHEGTSNTFWATASAINAGVDMVMLPFDYKTFTRHMKWGNRLGLISDNRIDEAVSRILYAKFSLGLFDADADFKNSDIVLDETHRILARDAVAQSLVLLKNQDATLPITTANKKIRVAGSSADNIGRQMGAWSIEWQGVDGNNVLGATSILEGIYERAREQGTQVEYDRLGEFSDTADRADIGVAIVGEKPYAEGWGDTDYPTLDEEDLLSIKNLQNSSKKVVVIIVSGRPLLITDEVDSFDALVAGWLPGSEGAGVADVLFGDKPFTGKLPLPWPAHIEQLPIAPNGQTNDGTDVLFPRYYGLRI